MTASLLLNALDLVALRVVIPWQGVWYADCDIDQGELPPGTPLIPGPAVLTVGTNALVGTIDPAAQGFFGARAGARVLGGRGGWGQSVAPQHFHNDAVLLDATIIAATAASVGEVAVVAVPEPLGVDYVRAAGPASAVLDGYDWHVDFAGLTQVAPRVPVPLDPTSYDVIDFDPSAQRVTLASDTLIQPGAILIDPRFGTLTVRDVEQTFSAAGARAECWCGTGAVSRLDAALSTYVRQKAGLAHLRCYEYRVIAQNVDGRVMLQPVDLLGPMPAMLPLAIWPGMAGLAATIQPGTIVLVHFAAGDPAKPLAMGFRGDGTPLTLTLNAITPLGVIVGGGAPEPVARMGLGVPPTHLAAWMTAVETALSAASHPVPSSWSTFDIGTHKLVSD